MSDDNNSGISNVKNKIEAVMFSSAKLMRVEEIAELTGIKDLEFIKKTLNELKADYESRGSSITLRDEGDNAWKLTVKDHYLPIVHKLVNKTELDRPLIETLAVIAWKYPVVQSEVIKIRHNKAYDHMRILEDMGFVTRTKFGRTRKVTLTDKFFEYFDLPSKEAKDAFLSKIPDNVKEDLKKKEQEIDDAEKKIEEHAKKREELEEFRRKEKKELKKKAEEGDKIPKPEPAEIKDIDEKVDEIEDDIKGLEEEEQKDIYKGEN
jgi:segregation and condensation protein B